MRDLIRLARTACEIALEISPLENLDQAETLTRQSLQTFQDFNRYKLQADTYKLLGEIYLKRTSQQQPDAKMTATQYLSDSLQLYRNLTLTQEIEDVQQLLSTVSISTELE